MCVCAELPPPPPPPHTHTSISKIINLPYFTRKTAGGLTCEGDCGSPPSSGTFLRLPSVESFLWRMDARELRRSNEASAKMSSLPVAASSNFSASVSSGDMAVGAPVCVCVCVCACACVHAYDL